MLSTLGRCEIFIGARDACSGRRTNAADSPPGTRAARCVKGRGGLASECERKSVGPIQVLACWDVCDLVTFSVIAD